ncbi:FH2 domain-containing protein 1-like isoform X3 [Rhincodon typus]|uniref:FH2 domain-containing protein 1-like isoform X3 n=1 Tax=Rhincodon typus TaxID=259920 RepID=UPI00202ED8A0|nr:FH2 domain-containing protein 1-like isoform X3 [Rhincodon typus]
MDCDELHTVIRLVLKAGNYMNAEAEKNDRKLLEFPNRLRNLGAASRLFKQELESEFEKLKQKLQLVKGNLDKHLEIRQQMETFIQKAERQLEEVQASVTELRVVSQQLAEYFCEDEEKFKLEECCQIFQNFREKFIVATQENKQRALLERKRREREKEEKKAKRISIASCSHMEKDLGGGDLESLLHNNRNSFRQRNSRQGEGSIPRSQSLKQIRARSEQNDSRNGSLTRDDAQRLREVSKKLLGFQVGAENSGQRHKQSKFAQTSRISEEYCEPAKASTTPSNGHAEVGQEQKERLLGSGVSGVPAVGESEQSGSLEPAATQHPGSLVPVKAQQTGSLDPVKAQQPGSLVPVKAQQTGSWQYSLSGGFLMGMDKELGSGAGRLAGSCTPDPGVAPSQSGVTPFPLAGNTPDSEQEQKRFSSNLPAESHRPASSSARAFRKALSHSFSGEKPRPAARKRSLTRGFSADKVPSSPAVRKLSITAASKSVKPITANKPTQKDEAKAEESHTWKFASFFSKKTSKTSMGEGASDGRVKKEVLESPSHSTNSLANFFKHFSDNKTTKLKNPSNATIVSRTDDGTEPS